MIDVGLGFSSGVVIVASLTSLLPAIGLGGFYRALAGFLAGV